MSDVGNVLQELDSVLQQRRSADPGESYIASLYAAGDDAVLAKVSEESAEFVEAAAEFLSGARSAEQRAHLVHEAADLWFHSLVALAHSGLDSGDILQELQARFGTSGHEEKRARGTRDTSRDTSEM